MFDFLYQLSLIQWKTIQPKLTIIKHVRNAIAHSTGFIPFKTVYVRTNNYPYYDINNKLSKNKFLGIKVITNMVYISEAGLLEMDRLFIEVTEFLSSLQI